MTKIEDTIILTRDDLEKPDYTTKISVFDFPKLTMAEINKARSIFFIGYFGAITVLKMQAPKEFLERNGSLLRANVTLIR